MSDLNMNDLNMKIKAIEKKLDDFWESHDPERSHEELCGSMEQAYGLLCNLVDMLREKIRALESK